MQYDTFKTYTYNIYGRSASVGSTTAVYDAFSRLVEVPNAANSQIVYAPGGGKFAYMNGQTVKKYLAPLAAGAQAVYTAATPAAPAYWLHSDWLGSARLGSTVGQSASGDQAYGPFGETYDATGSALNVFTGQTSDMGAVAGASPVYDFLFRQYSATQGRWMVPDPAGMAAVDITNPQTWNRYAYVGNNPLNNVDPLGLILCGTHENDPWCNGGGQGAGGGGGYYGGAPQYTLDGLPISGPLSGFGFGSNDIAGILPPGCSGGACIVNGIVVTPKSNGQFGGCSEGSGYYFWCIEFAPTPLQQTPLQQTQTSVPGAGGGARLVNPNALHVVAGNDPKITTKVFFQLWGAQLSCEGAVTVSQWADHGPLYAVGIYGTYLGLASGSTAGLGGVAVLGLVGISDAAQARETCVPAIWGPGHF